MPERPSRHRHSGRAARTRTSAATDAPRVLVCTLSPGVRYGTQAPDLEHGHVVGRLAIADDARPLAWLRRRYVVTTDTGRRCLWLDLFAN